MSTPLGEPLLIANPSAGSGRDSVLATLSRALRTHGMPHQIAETTGPGDATQIARDAVAAGRRYIVAVGGDGTVHEIVNGMVDPQTGSPHGEGLVLGVIAGGTGCDLARTFGFDRRPEVAVQHLLTDTTSPLDLGRVELTGRDGEAHVRVFANVAEAGYGGMVTDLANRLPRRLGTARYGAAILGAVARFRLVETSVQLDHTALTEPLSNIIVANGQFFGGGLNVAPRALPWNGQFNVQVWQGKPLDVLRAAPELRRGTHLDRDDVREWQSKTVVVHGPPLAIEADGEVLGTTPARFEVLPGVLQIKL